MINTACQPPNRLNINLSGKSNGYDFKGTFDQADLIVCDSLECDLSRLVLNGLLTRPSQAQPPLAPQAMVMNPSHGKFHVTIRSSVQSQQQQHDLQRHSNARYSRE